MKSKPHQMNRTDFGFFLPTTKEKLIVEQSAKDLFWGALIVDDGALKECVLEVMNSLNTSLFWEDDF